MSAQTLNYRVVTMISAPAALVAPSNLGFEVLSATAVRIFWQNNDGGAATGIQMDISPDNSNWTSIWGVGSLPPALNPSITEYIHTGLAGLTQYFIRIRCVNATNQSSYVSGNFTTKAQTAPLTAPTNFTATASGANTVNLAWTASAGSNSYTIERSMDGKTQWEGILSFSNYISGTTFQNVGLMPNTKYYYRIHGVNEAGGPAGGDGKNSSPPSPYCTTIASATTGAGAASGTFYVATNGNDANPGTIGSPWQTIAHALLPTSAPPGSTINIRGGTYVEGGTELILNSDNITLQAYQSEIVTITSTATIGLWMGGSNPGRSMGGLNTCIRNLNIGGVTPNPVITYPVKWEVGGQGFQLYLTDLSATQNVLTVTSPSAGFTPAMVGSYLSIILEGATGNLIPGVYLITSYISSTQVTLDRAPATAGNEVLGTAYVGGSIIDGCNVHDSGSHVLKSSTPGASYIIVNNCTINKSASNQSGCDMVLGWWIIIQDCTITNCGDSVGGTGIDFKGGQRYCLAQRNTISSGGYGIWLGQSTDSNLFDLTVNPLGWEAINCIARNNKIYSCQWAGIQSQGSDNCQIYNNTFYHVDAQNSLAVIDFKISDTLLGQQCRAPIVYNNLCQQPSSYTRAFVRFRNATYQGTPLIDNNLYWKEGGGAPTFDINGGLSLASWKAQGFDTHSVNADPLLSLTAPLYDLTPGSPAIDAAKTLTGFKDDIHQAIRPKGAAWDIGADEFA